MYYFPYFEHGQIVLIFTIRDRDGRESLLLHGDEEDEGNDLQLTICD